MLVAFWWSHGESYKGLKTVKSSRTCIFSSANFFQKMSRYVNKGTVHD